jgi:2-octaprenyl-6-methoxyphenol hydroxylase
LTTVPLAGNASSLVWVERPDRAEVLLALDDRAFAQELQSALASALGEVMAVGPRASFPLSGVAADVLGARRVALVGEAAHRLPPIGAQGLNLGLRDAAWLADLVADAVAEGADPGAPHVLRAYDDARRADVLSRTAVVDTLNRSLIADWLPADLARSAGLAALKTIGPLRRLFMREGMGPGGRLPRLMQPVERSASEPGHGVQARSGLPSRRA